MAEDSPVIAESVEAAPAAVDEATENNDASDNAELDALADDLSNTRLKRKGIESEIAGGFFVAQPKKPRCPACRYIFNNEITSWECPRCKADLREIGIARRRNLKQRLCATLTAISRRLRLKPRLGKTCAKCDYPTRGLGGFECPECGSDLREAGIVDRDQVDAGLAAAFAIAFWSALCLLGTFVAFDWASLWLVPQSMSRREHLELESNWPDVSYLVTINGAGKVDQWRFTGQAPLSKMIIQFTTTRRGFAHRFAQIELILPEWSYSYIGGSRYNYLGPDWKPGKKGAWFDRDVLLEAMKRIELDANDLYTQAQADELIRILAAIESSSVDASTITGFTAKVDSSTSTRPQGLNGRFVYVYFYALWVITSTLIGWWTYRKFQIKRAKPDV